LVESILESVIHFRVGGVDLRSRVAGAERAHQLHFGLAANHAQMNSRSTIRTPPLQRLACGPFRSVLGPLIGRFRVSYRMEVDHYDIVPQLVADKILANAKRPVDEEEE
jgi:hypothetical protein